MTPKEFKVELLTHIEDACGRNDQRLRQKASKFSVVTYAVAFEVGFVVLSIWLAL